MRIGKDVWFVGHCIVSPITAADKSMAMVGSVVTKDMEYNTIYAGCPASEISSKIGPQFSPSTLEERVRRMRDHFRAFGAPSSIRIVADDTEVIDDGRSYFVVASRTYTKRRTAEEVAFMKFLLPERAKFTPFEWPST
jgi:hypothetical protein